jgi:uncharacterized membrane protein
VFSLSQALAKNLLAHESILTMGYPVNEKFQDDFKRLLGRLRDPLFNRTALWAFIILGILFRFRQYQFDRSLLLDESFLALNIIRRSPAQLLSPLDNSWCALPIGFLWLPKVAVHWLGSSEMVLRLAPFLAGIASIFLFAMVARKFLSPGASLIAVALFSICNPLIYYSSEAKQYSTDAAIVLFLYLLADSLLEARLEPIRLLLLSVAGA